MEYIRSQYNFGPLNIGKPKKLKAFTVFSLKSYIENKNLLMKKFSQIMFINFYKLLKNVNFYV